MFFSMTDGAQQALRRTMEIYSKTTRFALACNNSEKIIEPIQSRCAMVRYSKLSDAQILAKLMTVCEKENVSHQIMTYTTFWYFLLVQLIGPSLQSFSNSKYCAAA